MADLTEEEQQQLTTLQWFYENKFSFNQLMSQQPQTLAYALADSPVGLLAWNAQLFGEGLDDDFVLTNVSLYWFTGTGGSAARLYYEDAHATPATEPTTMPTAVAAFGGDFSGIRRFADATTTTSSGGRRSITAGTSLRTRSPTCWWATSRRSSDRFGEAGRDRPRRPRPSDTHARAAVTTPPGRRPAARARHPTVSRRGTRSPSRPCP